MPPALSAHDTPLKLQNSFSTQKTDEIQKKK